MKIEFHKSLKYKLYTYNSMCMIFENLGKMDKFLQNWHTFDPENIIQ